MKMSVTSAAGSLSAAIACLLALVPSASGTSSPLLSYVMRKYCWDVPGMRLRDIVDLSFGRRDRTGSRVSALRDERRRHDGVGVAVHAVQQTERVVVLREEPFAKVEDDLPDGTPG